MYGCRSTFLFRMGLTMKRSYAYLLAAAGIVAAISGVAIAQQAAAPAAAPAAAQPAAAAEPAATAVAAPAAAFSIDQVQGMPVGIERGKLIAQNVCASCHNADGNSAAPANPKLAGQHAAYIEKQLHDFSVAEGAKAPARANMLSDPQNCPSQPAAGSGSAPARRGRRPDLRRADGPRHRSHR